MTILCFIYDINKFWVCINLHLIATVRPTLQLKYKQKRKVNKVKKPIMQTRQYTQA